MNMRLFIVRLFCVLGTTFCLVLLSATSVEAATIKFNPASGTHATGTSFAVKIDVDTEGVDTTSTDAVIQFDTSLLSIDSVSYGSFYDTVLHSESGNKLSISGMVSDPGKVVNGQGTLATINFMPLAQGTAIASFFIVSQVILTIQMSVRMMLTPPML